jgi:hypothetical protein
MMKSGLGPSRPEEDPETDPTAGPDGDDVVDG